MLLPMTEDVLIRLKDLNRSFMLGEQQINVLKQISLTIHQGEMVAIVGASGSGKSTLMNIIGLLDKPDSGEYWLQGRPVFARTDDELALLRNQHLGFVFQQFNLLSRFTAAQNVALPLTYRQLPASEIEARVMQVLARVGMNDYAAHRPLQLSGGQQQRVAIARALIAEPRVILADEPTGALDSRTGAEVMNLFSTLHKEGRTIILVTHDKQVASLCQRRITLADGEIVNEAL